MKNISLWQRTAVIAIVGIAVAIVGLSAVPAAAEGQEGGTLRIASSGIISLDPHVTNSDYDYAVLSQVFNGLVRPGKDGSPIPDLAASWDNPDDVTWVFHLRDDMYWHDDNPVFAAGESRRVTAHDVKYSLDRVRDPETASPLAGGFASIAEVEVVDEATVKIVTEAPDPFLLDPIRLAGFAIVPHEAVEQLGPEGFGQHPIGSGPFKFVRYRTNDHVVLERNEDYPIRPYLDGVTFRILPDPSVTVLALESGEVDVALGVPPQDVERLGFDPRVTLHRGLLGFYRGLGFNVETAPFDEHAVRRALTLSADIGPAVQNVFGENAEQAFGQVGPGVIGYDPSLRDVGEFDPTQAEALLRDAGFEKNSNGLFERDGELLTVEVKTINEPGRIGVLTILVTQWRQFGIDAHMRVQETATWSGDLTSGNTGLFMDLAFSGSTGLDAMFHSRNIGVSNAHFYRNAEVDRLLAEASRILDPEAREVIWKEAQRLVVEDAVIIPLYFEFSHGATDSEVHDFVPQQWTLNIVTVDNNVWIGR